MGVAGVTCPPLNQLLGVRGIKGIDWSKVVWVYSWEGGVVSRPQPRAQILRLGRVFRGESGCLSPRGKGCWAGTNTRWPLRFPSTSFRTVGRGGKESVPRASKLLGSTSVHLVSPAGTAQMDTVCERPSPVTSPDLGTGPEDCQAPTR